MKQNDEMENIWREEFENWDRGTLSSEIWRKLNLDSVGRYTNHTLENTWISYLEAKRASQVEIEALNLSVSAMTSGFCLLENRYNEHTKYADQEITALKKELERLRSPYNVNISSSEYAELLGLNAEMEKRYFFRDEYNGDFEEFDSLKSALKHAKEAINDLDGSDGWAQEVLDGAFQIGIITHESAETNRRENDRDDDGEVIDNEFDYLCDVEMIEVNDEITALKKELEATSIRRGYGLIKAKEAEINLLKAELKKERDCVDFYSDEKSWIKQEIDFICISDSDQKFGKNSQILCGGKLARETVKNRSVRL